MTLQTNIEFIGMESSPHTEDNFLDSELNDLLADDADWNDKYWKFLKNEISPFIDKLKALFEHSPNGITFSAIFPPDVVEKEISVTFSELEFKLRNNKVGTRTRYVVRKRA